MYRASLILAVALLAGCGGSAVTPSQMETAIGLCEPYGGVRFARSATLDTGYVVCNERAKFKWHFRETN